MCVMPIKPWYCDRCSVSVRSECWRCPKCGRTFQQQCEGDIEQSTDTTNPQQTQREMQECEDVYKEWIEDRQYLADSAWCGFKAAWFAQQAMPVPSEAEIEEMFEDKFQADNSIESDSFEHQEAVDLMPSQWHKSAAALLAWQQQRR